MKKKKKKKEMESALKDHILYRKRRNIQIHQRKIITFRSPPATMAGDKVVGITGRLLQETEKSNGIFC